MKLVMNWCARCHHAITRSGVLGGWGHFSPEDWSGWGDCACAEELTPCRPPVMPRKNRRPRTSPGDEITRLHANGPRPRHSYTGEPYVPVSKRGPSPQQVTCDEAAQFPPQGANVDSGP